jgi:hypothetical protein
LNWKTTMSLRFFAILLCGLLFGAAAALTILVQPATGPDQGSGVAVSGRLPVAFGVIVASNRAQALARADLPAPRRSGRGRARQAGGRLGNRGEEAALAALSMLRLFRQMDR